MSEQKTVITCVNNGPARIAGDFTLVYPDGREEEISGRISLCRCGMSGNMPICDGSHKNCVPRHDERELNENE